jgi:hypothetical protein
MTMQLQTGRLRYVMNTEVFRGEIVSLDFSFLTLDAFSAILKKI